MRNLIEAGLRAELARDRGAPTFKLRDASFRGNGLHSEFADAGWDRIRDAIYEGRGA